MATWEKDTWKPLVELADHHPEAGIHLQSKKTTTDQISAATVL
jgi:hypothetical protein